MELLARYLRAAPTATIVALIRADDDAPRRRGGCTRRCGRRSATRRALRGPGAARSRATSRTTAWAWIPTSRARSRARSPRSSTARRPCRSSSALRARRARSTSRARAGCSRSPSCAAATAGCGASRTSRRPTSPASTAARSARTTSTSASAFATPTSSRSSRPSGSCARHGAAACRSRSCARASSSATATAAGRRPSTSCTGRCARWRKGAYPMLPARRGAPVDVVSVDYVADAICRAARGCPTPQGGTFHLTASQDASSIGELLDLAVARLGCRRPPLDLAAPVPPRAWHRSIAPPAAAPAALPARDDDLPAVLRGRARTTTTRAPARRSAPGDRARAAGALLRRARRATRCSRAGAQTAR